MSEEHTVMEAADVSQIGVEAEAVVQETTVEDGVTETAAESEPAADGDDAAEASAEASVPTAKKRGAPSGEERLARRPRWNEGDKAFEDITMGDVETLVRRCNALEKQVEANSEASQLLKDAQKRQRELERQVEEYGPKEIALIKASIAKQFLAQMTYAFAWNQELKESGREVCAFLPNVSPDLLKSLGGDVNVSKTKQTKCFFDRVPSKPVQQPTTNKADKEKVEKPGGDGMVLGASIVLKYVKTSHELHIKGTYRFGACEKRKGGGRGRGKAKVAEDGPQGDEAAAPDEAFDEAAEMQETNDECAVGGA